MTMDAGLEVASYGSYYNASESEAQGLSFASVLDSAVTLGAPMVRVWAGKKNSEDAAPEYRKRVVDDLRRIGAEARTAGVKIGLEFHGGTLTNTNESALRLADELKGSNVLFYWQPPIRREPSYRLEGLLSLLPVLANLHVFQWRSTPTDLERLPLRDGRDEWRRYLDALASSSDVRRYAMLEFVKGDSTEQLLEDAAELREWLGEAGG